jgi:hypothetical protein
MTVERDSNRRWIVATVIVSGGLAAAGLLVRARECSKGASRDTIRPITITYGSFPPRSVWQYGCGSRWFTVSIDTSCRLAAKIWLVLHLAIGIVLLRFALNLHSRHTG